MGKLSGWVLGLKYSQQALEVLGEDGDPESRAAMLEALENYKAQKPTREKPPQADDQSPPAAADDTAAESKS